MAKKKSIPGLTPEQKLQQALHLYHVARQLKEAALRQFHPEWDEQQIKKKLKELFLYGRY